MFHGVKIAGSSPYKNATDSLSPFCVCEADSVWWKSGVVHMKNKNTIDMQYCIHTGSKKTNTNQ